jgi:hypothetical protein
VLLVFLTICVTRLGIDLSGGEEQYLGFARHFFDPDWIPGSFTITEYPGTRLLFQWIVGPLLAIVDFEIFTFFARLINFFLLSIPLTLILRHLKIGLAETFVLIQLFVMSEQNLFGGEWMIKTFEPKSIAYIFVFYGIHNLLIKQYRQVAVFFSLATFFHVLVGGWILLGILLVWAFSKKWKTAFFTGLIYGLLCLPFAVYLFYGYFMPDPDLGSVNTDWVYCYYRLSKHLGIFYYPEFFMSTHFLGIVLTLLALVATKILKNKTKDLARIQLANLALVFFCLNILFVGIAYIDHAVLNNAGSLGLKYYPFRSNSIACFFLLLLIFLWIRDSFSTAKIFKPIVRSILAVVIVLGVIQGINNVKRSLRQDVAFEEMTDFILKNTDNHAVFGLIGGGKTNKIYWSFMRKTERENFSETKFIPADKKKMVQWYSRNVDHIRMNNKPEVFPEVAEKHHLQYLLADRDLSGPHLTLIYSIGGYNLYSTGIPIVH